LICTFFGHRDTPFSVAPVLNTVLRELIIQSHVDVFYVGTQGQFDSLVIHELSALRAEFPHIRCSIILTALPKLHDAPPTGFDTLYPEGLETVPPRFAIDRRNRWMVTQSDVVVVYVIAPGGAAKFKSLAEQKGKRVINLA
jgi:hypothetical protein